MKPREEWQLFIDESGNFDSPEGLRLVTGLLIKAPDTEEVRTSLRSALEQAHPGIPWPPHSFLCNYMGGWVAQVLANQAQNQIDENLWMAAERIQSLLKVKSPEAHTSLRKLMKPGKKYGNDAQRLERYLQRLPPQLLTPFVVAQRTRTELLGMLFQELERDNQAFTVVSVVGDRTAGDPYLRAFETLVERVVALFRESPAKPESPHIVIRVHVASREIQPEWAPTRIPFIPKIMQGLLAHARNYPPYAPRDRLEFNPRLSFVFSNFWNANYGVDCHPGITLVDYLSNQTYRSLRDLGKLKHLTCQIIHNNCRSRLLLAPQRVPRLDSKALPTLAATGRAREAILEAYLPEGKVDPLTELEPVWMGEQSHKWQQFARRFPREEEGT